MIRLKRILVPILILTLLLALTGCLSVNFGFGRGSLGSVQGTGDMTSAEVEVGGYDSVDIGGAMKIIYSATPSNKVRLDIQENLRQFVTFRVNAGTLTVDCNRNLMTSYDKTPVLYLYNPNLKAIYASGGIELKDSEPIKADSFTLEMSGGANIELTLDVNKLDTNLSGAARIKLDGNAQNVDINVSGAGYIDALELYTKTARINLNGAAGASISCSDKLDIDLSGAGNLRYRGSPTVTRHISGAGSVQQVQ